MKKVFFIVSILFVTSVVFSQQKQVQTTIDTTKNKIGAEFKLTIKTTVDTAAKVAFPNPKILGALEVIQSYAIDTIKKDKGMRFGDIARVITLVDTRIMPNVDFQRMTSSAVGPAWRQATPEQQKRLQDEFKILLVRTYAGALSQVSDQVVFIKPVRIAPEDKEVIVRTEVRGGTDPIQLEYRMERTPNEGSGWKIYNINVLGVWLVETYKSQFTPIINTKGIDGLIESLVARNKTNTSAKKG
jgi:phospholipid transport system substrate-binding protein